jgi:aminoglycoside N3'-acetyltransferase
MNKRDFLNQSLTDVRSAITSGRSLIRKKYPKSISPVKPEQFYSILDNYDDEEVFVHAGLSDIHSAFKTDPYIFLRDALIKKFNSILVPGFSPSFKNSGLFHKKYSRPEYGMFQRLFLTDCDYRTDDPIHSILINGPYRFNISDKKNTFGSNGWFSQLESDNMLYLSIGMPWFRSTQLHYLECKFNVPYIERPEYQGVIYYDNNRHKNIRQKNYQNKNPHIYAFNKMKIEKQLIRAGVMDKYNLSGLRIYLTRAKSIQQVLAPKIRSDPYYLVN